MTGIALPEAAQEWPIHVSVWWTAVELGDDPAYSRVLYDGPDETTARDVAAHHEQARGRACRVWRNPPETVAA